MSDGTDVKLVERQAELEETKEEVKEIKKENMDLKNNMDFSNLMEKVDDFQKKYSNILEIIQGDLRTLTTTVSNNHDTLAEIKEKLNNLKETTQVHTNNEQSQADNFVNLYENDWPIQVNLTACSANRCNSDKLFSEINETLRKQSEDVYNLRTDMKTMEKETILLLGGSNEMGKMDSLLILQSNEENDENWTELYIKLPYAVDLHGAQFLDNTLYIFGGENGNNNVLNSTYKLTNSLNWESTTTTNENDEVLNPTDTVTDSSKCKSIMTTNENDKAFNLNRTFIEMTTMQRTSTIPDYACGSTSTVKTWLQLEKKTTANEEGEILNLTYTITKNVQSEKEPDANDNVQALSSSYTVKDHLQWEKMADMNEKRSCISNSSVILNNQIWVCGGWDNECNALKSVEMYDPQTNIWTNKKEMNECRGNIGAAVVNGKIFCFDGYKSDSVECYDPSSDCWTRISDKPKSNARYDIVAMDKHLIAIGATTDILSNVWILDTTDTNAKWIEKEPSLSRQLCEISIAKIVGKIFLCGGARIEHKDKYDHTDEVEIFDGEAWRKGPKLPSYRSDGQAVVVSMEFARELKQFIGDSSKHFSALVESSLPKSSDALVGSALPESAEPLEE